MLMYFSDYLPDYGWRNGFGIAYIVIVCVYAGIHLAFMFMSSLQIIYLRARYYFTRRRQIYNKQKKLLLA